jgi:REP element-mobilizing transposase RayT
MEVSADHVPIFCSFPPCYSIAQVVTRFKSLRARTVGDQVTAEVIRRYIQQPRLEKSGDSQLSLFE